jgi:hypothetical protein
MGILDSGTNVANTAIPGFGFLATGIGALAGGIFGALKTDPAKAAREALLKSKLAQDQLRADQYNRSMETITNTKRRDLSTMWNQYQMTEGATNAAALGGRGQFGKANNQTFATFANATDSMAGKYLDTITGLKDSASDAARQSQIDYESRLSSIPEDQPWYVKALEGAMGGASAGFQVDKGLYDSKYGDYLTRKMGTKPTNTNENTDNTDPNRKGKIVTEQPSYSTSKTIYNWKPDNSYEFSNLNLLTSNKSNTSNSNSSLFPFNNKLLDRWANYFNKQKTW